MFLKRFFVLPADWRIVRVCVCSWATVTASQLEMLAVDVIERWCRKNDEYINLFRPVSVFFDQCLHCRAVEAPALVAHRRCLAAKTVSDLLYTVVGVFPAAELSMFVHW